MTTRKLSLVEEVRAAFADPAIVVAAGEAREMVRGSASGGGYDKATAACADAASILPLDVPARHVANGWAAFRAALAKDGGARWHAALAAAGFTVLQVV